MLMNQKGMVTAEFLIAIAIAFGLTLATFALTFTLSTVEAYQYVIYSTSRAHAAASFDVDTQKKSAIAKYNQLTNSEALKSLFSNGWFEVSKGDQLEIRSGNGDNFEKDYAATDNKKNLQGVRGTFKSKLMEMRLPFLGSISPEGDGFSARLNAILIREVSHKECVEFMEKRAEELWTFDGSNRFSKFKKSSNIDTPWEDNGC